MVEHELAKFDAGVRFPLSAQNKKTQPCVGATVFLSLVGGIEPRAGEARLWRRPEWEPSETATATGHFILMFDARFYAQVLVLKVTQVTYFMFHVKYNLMKLDKTCG